jgi:hypothetical protein
MGVGVEAARSCVQFEEHIGDVHARQHAANQPAQFHQAGRFRFGVEALQADPLTVSDQLQRSVVGQPRGDGAVGGIEPTRDLGQVCVGLLGQLQSGDDVALRLVPRLTAEQSGPRITPVDGRRA